MSTVSRMPITKARINLGKIAWRAHNDNEYFILEKDGIPVIGIMAADEMEDYLELRDARVKSAIAASRKDRENGKTRPATSLLAELKKDAVKKNAKSGVPMAPSNFAVSTTAHFDRLLKELAPKHPGLVEGLEEAISILSVDPYNRTRKYAMKKLQEVTVGEGQYRLRSGRFRFRYDIEGREVVLLCCGLRREDTY
jgi:mRNA-degrading endonuclease RelE of RelBE toxin-antitoxin system